MKKKLGYLLLALAIIIIGIVGYGYKVVSTGFDINKTTYIYITTDKNYTSILKQLEDSAKVESISSFKTLASLMNYDENIKSGRYAVKPDMNILDLIRDLRNGHQSPVKLKFNNIRTKKNFAKRISQQMMMSEDLFLNELKNASKCKELGFDTLTIVAMFIPNTYEFYWDTTIDNFLKRMKKEYDIFWNEDRLSKAEKVGLTPLEVSTLASIVEEECTYSDEYPIVAGLYLNRLHKGQALQADPTVKFANGDFSLRRILNKHLEINSPYNTYRHTGLPPGPIRIPSIKGIDSVLNYNKHDYFYMCAKEDFSGRHNFAATFAIHQQNAARYRNALNKRGIF